MSRLNGIGRTQNFGGVDSSDSLTGDPTAEKLLRDLHDPLKANDIFDEYFDSEKALPAGLSDESSSSFLQMLGDFFIGILQKFGAETDEGEDDDLFDLDGEDFGLEDFDLSDFEEDPGELFDRTRDNSDDCGN